MKSIATKFILPVVFVAVLFVAVDVYFDYAATRDDLAELMGQKAALGLAFDLAIRGYVAEEIRPVMEERTTPDEFIPETMSTSFVARSIFEKLQPWDIFFRSPLGPALPWA